MYFPKVSAEHNLNVWSVHPIVYFKKSDWKIYFQGSLPLRKAMSARISVSRTQFSDEWTGMRLSINDEKYGIKSSECSRIWGCHNYGYTESFPLGYKVE